MGGEMNFNTEAWEAAAAGAFPELDFSYSKEMMRRSEAQVEAIEEELAAIREAPQPVMDRLERQRVTALDRTPQGDMIEATVGQQGQIDRSTLRFIRGGPRGERTVIDMDFGPGSGEEFTGVARSGPLASRRVPAVLGGVPPVFLDQNGNPFIYLAGNRRGSDRELIPVRVRVVSQREMAIRETASSIADFTPLVVPKAIGDTISGRDSYTGRRIDRRETALKAVAGAAGGAIATKAVKIYRGAGQTSRVAGGAADDVARGADDAARGADDAARSANPVAAGGASTLPRSGRSGKQARLRELGEDPKVASADRGWIQQELNSIARGQRRTIRVPPGKNLAHRRGYEAKYGFGYQHSDLQDIVLHKLQHKFEGY
jgi:hypothetical protein